MSIPDDAPIPPGWIGGFKDTDPAFAYPDPDLSSLPMLGNMDNIPLLQRQQGVEWPEFSWEIEPGDPSTRCFQQFAPYISRLGYNNAGRVYSVICPQQGLWFEDELCLNVEVTVTGQRGWVDEPAKEMALDMTVEGRIWFTPGLGISRTLKSLLWLLRGSHMGFPLDKAHAIRVQTHDPGDASQPLFPVRDGESPLFEAPGFARHPEAWNVANLGVGIGDAVPTHVRAVDDFNEAVMEVFNLGSGNMLKPGNVLTWNLWFNEPELVNQTEWAHHAQKWRMSIDTHHGSPTGAGTDARYVDGTTVKPLEAELLDALKDIIERHVRSVV